MSQTRPVSGRPIPGASYAAFTRQRLAELVAAGAEMDCDDLARKLHHDYKQAHPELGLQPDRGRWETPTPERPCGLPTWKRGPVRPYDPDSQGRLTDDQLTFVPGAGYHVLGRVPTMKGPNYRHSGDGGADQLATLRTRPVPDLDGDGVAGWDARARRIDVDDLQPGDIVFFDHPRGPAAEPDDRVDHTTVVEEVRQDGTIVLVCGSFDDLSGDGDQRCELKNLDLTPVRRWVIPPDPADANYRKFFVHDHVWGVRRFKDVADPVR